jgi:hypothetical protein
MLIIARTTRLFWLLGKSHRFPALAAVPGT